MPLLRATLLMSLFITLVGCSDVVESNHATIATAKLDIEHGWIPPILPVSTVQIKESHDLDINAGHGTFNFGSSDAEKFRAALTVMPTSEAIRGAKIPRDQMEREGYSFYQYKDFYIAVDWTRHIGEFWIAHSR